MGRGALWRDNEQSTFVHIHIRSSHSTTSPWSPIPYTNCVSTPPPSGNEMDAFEILRGRLLDAAILALPKRHRRYIVDVDASYEQLGCCLQQQ